MDVGKEGNNLENNKNINNNNNNEKTVSLSVVSISQEQSGRQHEAFEEKGKTTTTTTHQRQQQQQQRQSPGNSQEIRSKQHKVFEEQGNKEHFTFVKLLFLIDSVSKDKGTTSSMPTATNISKYFWCTRKHSTYYLLKLFPCLTRIISPSRNHSCFYVMTSGWSFDFPAHMHIV